MPCQSPWLHWLPAHAQARKILSEETASARGANFAPEEFQNQVNAIFVALWDINQTQKATVAFNNAQPGQLLSEENAGARLAKFALEE